MTLIDEISEGKGILVNITGGEALIGHVKVREEVLLLDQGGHLLPLLGAGVHAGGVVGAGVQEDDGALRDVSDVLHGSGEVKAIK